MASYFECIWFSSWNCWPQDYGLASLRGKHEALPVCVWDYQIRDLPAMIQVVLGIIALSEIPAPKWVPWSYEHAHKHPGVAENIAPFGDPGSDIMSQIKLYKNNQKAVETYCCRVEVYTLVCPWWTPSGAIISANPGCDIAARINFFGGHPQ